MIGNWINSLESHFSRRWETFGLLIACFLSLSTLSLASTFDCSQVVAGGQGQSPYFFVVPRAFRHGATNRTLVIGTGNIVVGRENGYLRAAELAKKTGAQFFFADNSQFWGGRDRHEDVAKIEKVGPFFDYRPVDGNSAYDRLGEILQALQPDTVIIATPDRFHVEVATEVLTRDPGVKRVVIEKPLSHSLEVAENFEKFLIDNKLTDRVFVVDHFRARFPGFAGADLHRMLAHLGHGIAWGSIYYLEDGSGAPHDGAIENANRVATLDEGVAIFDLLAHVLGLAQFADPQLRALRLSEFDGGKYTGVDGDPDMPSRIKEETFGRLRYRFQSSVQGYPMDFNLTTYMGKGIKGHVLNGVEYVKNVKLIFLKGLDPKKAILMDLGSIQTGESAFFANAVHLLETEDGEKWYVPEGHSIKLVDFPYHALMEMEVTTPGRNHGVMPFSAAMQMQRLLEDARTLRNRLYPEVNGIRPYFNYPGYVQGIRDEAPSLETLLKIMRQHRLDRRATGRR